MEFREFKTGVQRQYELMTRGNADLFTVELDKEELWNLYLDSFPEGTNELFRERREYDCCCCRQFVKAIGNVVTIKDNVVATIWDFEVNNTTFKPVARALSEFVKSKAVDNVFISKFKKIGTDFNYEEINGQAHKWEHFYLELQDKFVTSRTIGDVQGEKRAIKDVFKRSLTEISEESVLTVLELISQNSLYKGEEWKSVLSSFLTYKRGYNKLNTELDKNNYAWEQSLKAGAVVGKIKNHSIGTLLINISEGMDLDVAVRKYEVIVAPSNYKRPKAIFTKKMVEDAQKTIADMGYSDSLGRRFATLDDITVNNILFSNKDSAKRINKANVFDDLLTETTTKAKKFNKVEEVTIDKFINSILPSVREVEVYLENKHSSNMVSLIAPKVADSKIMFKWDNNFTWAYSGNITDSSMKDRVKSAGGKVDGVLRFSIQWNDIETDRNDLDAHCVEPSGNMIYFGRRQSSRTYGELDVDIRCPSVNEVAVENITWGSTNRMECGVYKFYVNNYSHNGGRSGFRAEIEFNGQVYSFEYNKELRNGEKVNVAEVTYDGVGGFTIKELLPSSVSSRDVWNLKTNNFIPVSVVMQSPNYWNEQEGIGNRHYFFMIKDCINNESPNGFYNEFLKQDLLQHKRVFEALGSKMRVEDVEDQLSGLGFSSTKRNELIIKVKGQTERVLKIKF